MTVNVSKPVVNVREKLAELDKPTGIAGEAMLRAETPQEQFNLIGAGRRNLIINGDFQVWQRGTSMSSTVNAFTMQTADRWYVVRSLLNQETDTWGNPYAHVVCGNYADSNYLQHKVEYPRKLAGKTLTLSFWMKSDDGLGADGSVYIRNFDGGGYNVHVSFESFTFGTEWRQFTFTFDIPESTTFGNDSYGLEIFIYGNVSSTNQNGKTFDIKEVQLELGKVATPFEHRSYGEELALCQRYYQVLIDAAAGQRPVAAARANSTSTLEFHLPLTVGMRDITSLPQSNMGTVYIYTDSARVNTTSATIVLNDDYLVGSSYAYLRITGASVADDRAYTIAGYEASAFLAVDGEL
jgi:hypothetical protein